MHRAPVSLAAIVLLAACSTLAAEHEPELRAREPQEQCDAATVQEYVGQRASQELGAILLQRTGAQILRWVPPNSAVSMDYRPDRLTVSYDDNMMIERISCG